jgi:hypothetical protein
VKKYRKELQSGQVCVREGSSNHSTQRRTNQRDTADNVAADFLSAKAEATEENSLLTHYRIEDGHDRGSKLAE